MFKQAWGMIHTAHPRVIEAVIKGMGMDKGQRDAFRQRVEARVERTIRVQNVSARCEECVVSFKLSTSYGIKRQTIPQQIYKIVL